MTVSPKVVNPILHFLLLSSMALSSVPVSLNAAFEERASVASALGTGCSLASSPWHPAGRVVNPAAGSWNSRLALSVSYLRPFELRELDRMHFDLLLPVAGMSFGISAFRQGRELYSEQLLMTSLSRPLTPWLALGLAAGRAELHMDRYGTDSAWLTDAGLLLNFRPIQAALTVNNLLVSGLTRYGERAVPGQGVAALSVQPDEGISITIECRLEEQRRPEWHFAAEFAVHRNLVLGSGFAPESERLFVGIGIHLQQILAGGSYDRHPWLGWTRGFAVAWRGGMDDAE